MSTAESEQQPIPTPTPTDPPEATIETREEQQQQKEKEDEKEEQIPQAATSDVLMSPRRQNWYRRIMRFYLYRNPEHATPEQVHRVLQQFEKVGYEKMIVLLVKKYGPEPDPPRIQQRRHSEITTNDLQH
eukprot:PhF_6_TR4222/c1_g1_i1/m.5693